MTQRIELKGTAAMLHLAGSLGMSVFYVLLLLDDFDVVDLSGVWRVLWYLAAATMLLGLAGGYLLAWRAHRATNGS